MNATKSDRDALGDYRPVLQYDSIEYYYADSARSFVENYFAGGPLASYGNVLRSADGRPIATASGDTADEQRLRLELLGPEGGKYSNGAPVEADDFLDASTKAYIADARRAHEASDLANVVYGTVRPGRDGRRWLQYWLFFYYNDKAFSGFGLHEGDWEGIQIRLGPTGEPEEVTYAQHGGGERAEWSDVELDPETGAPVVYVARGSHASYLRPGTHSAPVVDDICDAGGARVRPRLEVFDDAEPWTRWPGRWGASKKHRWVSFPSPDSPWKQLRWRDPDKFHSKATPFDERRAAEEEIEEVPPVVVATRSGATIHVDVTAAPDAAMKLVVATVVDGEPQPLEYDLSDLPDGEQVTVQPGGERVAVPAPDDDRL